MRTNVVIGVITLLTALACSNAYEQTHVSPQEARAIAKEAYLYANPVVDSYWILYSYFVNPEDAEFKAPWNEIKNISRVYTHEDRAVQSPNSDTPYSWLALDLRTEPIVLTVPEIEEDRYFSIQLIDLYTHNFAYIGSRTTGNEGGQFLIAGPGWEGEVPDGITKTIRAETQFVLAVYRTQLFSTDDLKKVTAIQSGYKAQPLFRISRQAGARGGARDRIHPSAVAGGDPDVARGLRTVEFPTAVLPYASVRAGTHGAVCQTRYWCRQDL